MAFSAQDVKKLRDATGVGMMDAKKALEATDGNMDDAVKWLFEKGISKAAERSDRENTQGAIALGRAGSAAAIVELKSETDFVAKSPDFVALAQAGADAVAKDGDSALASLQSRLDELKISLKENIDWGRSARLEPGAGNAVGTYLHVQNDRGVNGVLVEVSGGDDELARMVALHIAFARPSVLAKDDFPPAEVEEQRALLETATRNEGKPEQALPKIVEGKLQGWFKRVPGGALLEQPWTHDEKQSVTQALGAAKIERFAQVEIG
jgi:elongation factor Ts